jgi:Family of unknown function (DUF6263)
MVLFYAFKSRTQTILFLCTNQLIIMTKRMFLPLCMALLCTVISNAQKIAVTKGQKLETVSTSKMTMEVMGQNIDNETSATSQVEVKSVNDNGFVFANTLKRMLIKGSAMGQDINFDSDKKEDMDGQMGQALKGRIGVEKEIMVDKQGKVAGTKDTATAIAGGMTDIMNMAGEVSKGQPYAVLIQLPGRNIKPGDSWTDSIGTAETLKTVTTYTLKGITNDGVAVSFTGTVAKSGTIQQQGMEIQMDISGTVKGDAIYETATGLLKRNDTSSEITGTMGVMGQNAPIAMKMTVTTVTKKL